MSILTNCQRNENAFIKEDLSKPKTVHDLSYGKDTAQRMDVYLPANRSVDSTKSIVLIHGGGWNSGGKNEFVAISIPLKNGCPVTPFLTLSIDW